MCVCVCFSVVLSGQRSCFWPTFSAVERGQATETLSLKVTEGPSSSGSDSNASFAQESSSGDISLLNGLLKDIMHLLDP